MLFHIHMLYIDRYNIEHISPTVAVSRSVEMKRENLIHAPMQRIRMLSITSNWISNEMMWLHSQLCEWCEKQWRLPWRRFSFDLLLLVVLLRAYEIDIAHFNGTYSMYNTHAHTSLNGAFFVKSTIISVKSEFLLKKKRRNYVWTMVFQCFQLLIWLILQFFWWFFNLEYSQYFRQLFRQI